MRRKIQAILLLCLWVFQSILPYVLLEYQKYECRKGFEHHKRSIPAHQMVRLVFPHTGPVPCYAGDKEFLYHGKLYDVLTYDRNDSATVIQCVADTKEDAVVMAHLKVLRANGKGGAAKYKQQFAPDFKCVLPSASVVWACAAIPPVLPSCFPCHYRFDFNRYNYNPPEVLS